PNSDGQRLPDDGLNSSEVDGTDAHSWSNDCYRAGNYLRRSYGVGEDAVSSRRSHVDCFVQYADSLRDHRIAASVLVENPDSATTESGSASEYQATCANFRTSVTTSIRAGAERH